MDHLESLGKIKSTCSNRFILPLYNPVLLSQLIL